MTSQRYTRQFLPVVSHKRWTMGLLLIFLSVTALAISGVIGVGRAATMWHAVQETGTPGYLTLRSDHAEPYWQNLAVGQEVSWQIEATLQDADSSTLDLELRSDGRLVHSGQMLVQVNACDTEFVIVSRSSSPSCRTGHTDVLETTPLADVAQPDSGWIFPLAKLQANTPRYLLVTLGIPASVDPQAVVNTNMTIGVGLHASGGQSVTPMIPPTPYEQGQASSPPPLAATGLDAAVLVLLGIGLAGILFGGYLVKTSRERP
ncbi:MAG TPA: hypothetical protein VIG71_03860 [Enteractinococcus sp.]